MLYAVAALIVLDQLTEVAITAWPLRVSDLSWRFGLFGLFAGRATAFLVADGLVLATAVFFGDPRPLRAWGVIHLVLAVPLAVGLGTFGLDVVQLSRTVRPDVARSFKLAAARAAVMGSFGLLYCIVAGLAAYRGSRRSPRRSGDSAESLLVVES